MGWNEFPKAYPAEIKITRIHKKRLEGGDWEKYKFFSLLEI